MEHVTLTYKKLNSRAFDPIVPKDGIGNIQVIGYIKDIITSGTTKKVHTGISLHIQEGYRGNVSLDPDMARHPWSLVIKSSFLPSENSDELIFEIVNVGPYPQKIVPGQAIARISVLPMLKTELMQLKKEKKTRGTD